jgi:putative transcriptional regulator
MLHGHAEWVEPAVPGAPPREVASGVYLGDAQCLTRVTESKPGSKFRYRLFTGFSGWGPGQLEGELAAGVWSIHPASGQLLFDIPFDDLWELLALPKIPQPSLN